MFCLASDRIKKGFISAHLRFIRISSKKWGAGDNNHDIIGRFAVAGDVKHGLMMGTVPPLVMVTVPPLVYQLILILVSYTVNLALLIILAGDVEVNPGPLNARFCPCEVKKKGHTISCSSCSQKYHIDCVGLDEITEAALNKLKSWKCILCHTLPNEVKSELVKKLCPEISALNNKMEDMEERLNSKIDKISEMVSKSDKAREYSAIASKNLEQKVINTNRLMQNMSRQGASVESEQSREERNTRTLIVRNYTDRNIRNSQDIRSKIMKEFPGTVIRDARTTPGGSIVLVLDEDAAARKIKENWKKNWFGGNAGIVQAKNNPPSGMVKHVIIDDKTDNQIIEEIKSKYPNTEVDLFKTDNVFNGKMKIEFETKEHLEAVMRDRITIFQGRYMVENYNYKPRVIMCKNCQRFGHVARLCRSNHPVCGKCCSEDHETSDCEEDNLKCYHCDGNHETGHKDCEKMKMKLQQITDRRNGFA